MTVRVRIGVSGWRYPPWRGHFYPEDLLQRDELAYAASVFDTLEINGTFYSLQRPESFQAWYSATPRGFRFSVKGSRYITHILKLADFDAALANFYASGVLLLREKLGPFLWQLPAWFRYDPERFERFFTALPRSTPAAADLAASHDARLRGRASFEVDRPRPIHHVLEVRHASFLTPECAAQLRRHGVGLVVSEGAGRWPLVEEVTARPVYLRLHGSRELYRSHYTPAELRAWAAKVRAWRDGRTPAGAARIPGVAAPPERATDVYVYFDNTDKLAAPEDARRFRALIDGG